VHAAVLQIYIRLLMVICTTFN